MKLKNFFLLLLLSGATTSLLAFPMVEDSSREVSRTTSAQATGAARRATEEGEGNLGASSGKFSRGTEISSAVDDGSGDTVTGRTLTLGDFETALKANSNAARFVIQKDAEGNRSLQALQEEPTSNPIIRGENMDVTSALKAALASEAPTISVTDLFVVDPMTTLGSYPALSGARLREVLQRVDKAIPKPTSKVSMITSSSLARAAEQANKAWKEEIDAQDFSTLPDEAIFWSGYHEGNLTRATAYAALHKEKKMLEKTPGGAWLQGHRLYDKESYYSKSTADPIWSYVSEKFVSGVSGHIIAFVLRICDPNSIYRTIEKPILEEYPHVFLSQKFPREASEPWLTAGQQAVLQPHEEKVLGWLSKAEAVWKTIDTANKFQTQREAFLRNRILRDVVDESDKEFQKFHAQQGNLFLEKAKALIASWEGLCIVVTHLHHDDPREAQVTQVSKVRKSFGKTQGLQNVNLWQPHCDWLADAAQTVDYYIFKAYRASNQNQLAATWKKNCQNFEERLQEKMLSQPRPKPFTKEGEATIIPSLVARSISQVAQKTLEEELQQEVERALKKAQQAERRASAVWNKPATVVEEDLYFLKHYLENSMEAAKEAYLRWNETANQYQKAFEGVPAVLKKEWIQQQNYAEEKKTFWLEKLSIAHIESPLKRNEKSKSVVQAPVQASPRSELSMATSSTSPIIKIVLPAITDTALENRRLDLRAKIDQLMQEARQAAEQPVTGRPRRSSSSESLNNFNMVLSADEQMERAFQEWRRLVREADTLRQANKKELPFPNDEKLFEVWKEHDQQAIIRRKEREKQEREERIAATWEADMHRCETLAKIDPLYIGWKRDEAKYEAHRKLTNVDDKDWRDERDKLKAVAMNSRKKYEIAQIAWEEMAEQHSTICHLLEQEEAVIKQAKKKLEKADRVVIELWRKFQGECIHGIFDASRIRIAPATKAEIENCKKVLIVQKKEALSAVLPLKTLLEKYAATIQEHALSDARDLSPGDPEAWKWRVEEAEREATKYKTTRGASPEEAERLERIAVVDRSGHQTFLAEVQRLDDIKKTWIAVSERKAAVRNAAAASYFQGDRVPWIMLTSQERSHYNEPIRQANETGLMTRQEDLEAEAKLAEEENRRLQDSFIASMTDKERAQKREREANAALMENYQTQIQHAQERVARAQSEARRNSSVYGRMLSIFENANTATKAVEELVQAETTLIDLEANRAKLKRKANWPRLTAEEQKGTEQRALALEEKEKRERIAAIKLTSQEKEKQGKGTPIVLSKKSSNTFLTQGEQARILGNQTTVTRHGTTSLTEDALSKAALARNQASEAQVKGNFQAVENWQKSEQAYEEQAAALTRGDQAAAEKSEKIAKTLGGSVYLPGAAWAHYQASEAQAKGYSRAAEAWRKSAQAYEEQAAAFIRGDQDTAKKYEKIAMALGGSDSWYPGAAWAYHQAMEAQVKGRSQVVELYCKSAQVYEEQAAALTRGAPAVAERYKKIAKVLGGSDYWHPGAAWAYDQVVEEETKGNLQAADAWRKSAQAREEQAAVLTRGDEGAAEKYGKIAKALGGSDYCHSGAAWAYQEAAKEQAKENLQTAEAWRKSAQAHEEQAAALMRGDEEAAEKHEKVATAWGGGKNSFFDTRGQLFLSGAAKAYRRADEEQLKGNSQAAEAWRKSAQTCEEAVAALMRGDQEAAIRYAEIAMAWGELEWTMRHGILGAGVARAYRKVAEEQNKRNAQAAELYRKSGQAWKDRITALTRGDEETEKKYGKIADVWEGAARASRRATEEQIKGNFQIAELYRKSIKAYKDGNTALTREEREDKGYVAIAGVWEEAAWAYRESIGEQAQGNFQAAEVYRKCGQACEKQAAALIGGDEKTAEKYGKVAELWGGCDLNPGAAWFCQQVTEVQATGNFQVAEVFRKGARACEEEAAALLQGDEKAVKKYNEVITVLQFAISNYCYASDRQAEGNFQVAEVFRKAAQACEQQAEALIQGDQAAAEKYKKIAKALQASEDFEMSSSPGVIWAYKQATEEQIKGNTQAAELYHKSGQAYEAQVEALARGDDSTAEKYEKIAKALGGSELVPGAVMAYRQAVKEQAKGKHQVAELYRKSAQTYEEQAAALTRGEKTLAEKYEKSASAQFSMAWTSSRTAEEQVKGNHKIAEIYRKSSHAYAEQMSALTRRDHVAAERHEKIAGAWRKSAEAYEKQAATLEKQTAALARGDQTAAEDYGKVADLLGGSESSPGAAWYYTQAAGATIKKEDQLAENYYTKAQSCENQAAKFLTDKKPGLCIIL